MLIVLAVSIAWSLGVITLTLGHLTIFSVMFISIVVGIGIDYGIYFLFRYEEELFLGRRLNEALEITAARTGPGMLLGALTAGGTFFVLMLTEFRGIKELGYIAGLAIMLSWLAMMTVFPAVLVLVDRRHADRPRDHQPRAHRARADPGAAARAGHAAIRWPCSPSPAATVASLWALPSVAFDYNLLNLQAKGTESVAWEKRILATTGRSGFNGSGLRATPWRSCGGCRRRSRSSPPCPRWTPCSGSSPTSSRRRVAIITSFAPLVAPVKIGRSSPVDLEHLTRVVRDLKRRFDVAAAEGGEKLPPELRKLRDMSGALLKRLETIDREVAEPALTHLQAQLYRDFVGQVLRAPAEPPAAAHHAAGRARRAPPQVHRSQRAFSAPDPPEGGHLGAGGRGALRAGPAHGGPRRHRRPRHHLRGDPPHGARLPPGHRSTPSCSSPS